MSKNKIGLQLWSLHDDCQKNLASTIEAVGKMGYEGVEFAGLYDKPVSEWNKMLADAGLFPAGAHIQIDQFLAKNLEKTLDTYEALGCKRLICPGFWGDWSASLDGYRRACSVLNVAAMRASKRGFEVGFHNHDHEFKLLQNHIPYDIIAGTLTSDIILQLDVGWLYAAGCDGVSFIREHRGRVKSLHIKPYHKDNPLALLNDDQVPWKEVFKEGNECGTDWFIVEIEHYPVSPLESVEKSLNALRDMGL